MTTTMHDDERLDEGPTPYEYQLIGQAVFAELERAPDGESYLDATSMLRRGINSWEESLKALPDAQPDAVRYPPAVIAESEKIRTRYAGSDAMTIALRSAGYIPPATSIYAKAYRSTAAVSKCARAEGIYAPQAIDRLCALNLLLARRAGALWELPPLDAWTYSRRLYRRLIGLEGSSFLILPARRPADALEAGIDPVDRRRIELGIIADGFPPGYNFSGGGADKNAQTAPDGQVSAQASPSAPEPEPEGKSADQLNVRRARMHYLEWISSMLGTGELMRALSRIMPYLTPAGFPDILSAGMSAFPVDFAKRGGDHREYARMVFLRSIASLDIVRMLWTKTVDPDFYSNPLIAEYATLKALREDLRPLLDGISDNYELPDEPNFGYYINRDSPVVLKRKELAPIYSLSVGYNDNSITNRVLGFDKDGIARLEVLAKHNGGRPPTMATVFVKYVDGPKDINDIDWWVYWLFVGIYERENLKFDNGDEYVTLQEVVNLISGASARGQTVRIKKNNVWANLVKESVRKWAALRVIPNYRDLIFKSGKKGDQTTGITDPVAFLNVVSASAIINGKIVPVFLLGRPKPFLTEIFEYLPHKYTYKVAPELMPFPAKSKKIVEATLALIIKGASNISAFHTVFLYNKGKKDNGLFEKLGWIDIYDIPEPSAANRMEDSGNRSIVLKVAKDLASRTFNGENVFKVDTTGLSIHGSGKFLSIKSTDAFKSYAKSMTRKTTGAASAGDVIEGTAVIKERPRRRSTARRRTSSASKRPRKATSKTAPKVTS